MESGVAKYEVVGVVKNVELLGEVLTLKRVRDRRPSHTLPVEKPKSTKELLIEFMTKQEKFNQLIRQGISNLSNRFDNLIKINGLKE